MRQNLSLTKSSRKFKYLVSFLLALVLFSLLFVMDKLLIATEFNIKSSDKISSIYGLESYRNKNLVLISTNEMAAQLKNQNPQIKEIEVIKIYPHTLLINISLYKPLAVIDNAGEFFYLSEDGRILNRSSTNVSSFPVIYYYQKLNKYSFIVGDWITFADIKYSLHFIKTLSDLGMTVDRVDINGADVILFKIGEKEIIFTTKINRELQDYELQQIVRQFKIKGQEFKRLDLRFEKPVVKF